MGYCNKKGSSAQDTIVHVIIAIIALVILFGATVAWGTEITNYAKRASCKWSAVIKDKSVVFGVDSSNYELRCPPVTVEIKADSKKDPNEIIVSEMKDCWDVLGRGKLEIISKYGFKTNVACVVCSKIIPDGSQGSSIEISPAMLIDTVNSYELADEDKSFINYFTGKDEQLKADLSKSENIEITKSNPLYVTYFFYNLKGDVLDVNALNPIFAGTAVVAASSSGRKAVLFVFKKTVGKVLGPVAGLGIILAEAGYRGDIKQGVALLSGEQIKNSCNELK